MSKETSRQAPRSVPNHWGGNADPEPNSGVPIEMPLNACRPTPLNELIARFVRTELAQQTENEVESWDEANDFEDEDGDGLLLNLSPYELKDLESDPGSYDLEASEPPSEAPEEPIPPPKEPDPPEAAPEP